MSTFAVCRNRYRYIPIGNQNPTSQSRLAPLPLKPLLDPTKWPGLIPSPSNVALLVPASGNQFGEIASGGGDGRWIIAVLWGWGAVRTTSQGSVYVYCCRYWSRMSGSLRLEPDPSTIYNPHFPFCVSIFFV